MYKIPAKTLFVGHPIVFVPECHSTNSEVQHLIQQNGATDGVVFITSKQTKGRGQQGNTWESEPGKNLTFSIGLRPHFVEIKDQFLLSMAISLAVYDHLSMVLGEADIKVKWPNDIMVNDKKICGILIENSISGNTMQHSVVGIGLNVNQDEFHTHSATSMMLVSKEEYVLSEMLENLLSCVEKRYLQIRAMESLAVKKNYLDVLYWKDENRSFLADGKQFQGVITGIDPTGKLVILSEGVGRTFGFKEVRFLAGT